MREWAMRVAAGAKEQRASCATMGHRTRGVLGASGVDDTVEVRRDKGCCRFEVSCEVRRFTSPRQNEVAWSLDSIPDFSTESSFDTLLSL